MGKKFMGLDGTDHFWDRAKAWILDQIKPAVIDKQAVIDAVYPIGSLYWSSKDTDPSTLFGGTSVQIKDRFVLACGDTYTSSGATGGASSVTLSVSNMPSHTHSFTPSGTVSSHSHTINSGNTSSAGSKTTAGIRHSGSTSGMSANSTGRIYDTKDHNGVFPANSITGVSGCISRLRSSATADGWRGDSGGAGFYGIEINVSHTHTLPSSYIYGSTDKTQPTFTGSEGTTGSNGSGTSFSILPPYVVKYCWERTA